MLADEDKGALKKWSLFYENSVRHNAHNGLLKVC